MDRTEELKAEQDFIDTFSAKLEDAAPGDSTTAEHDASDGKRPANESTEHDTDDDEQTADDDASDDDDAADDSDEEEEGTGDVGGDGDEEDDLDDEEDPGESGDPSEDEDEKSASGESTDDEEEGRQSEADVRQALKDAGLKITLADLPKEAQPLVRRALDQMQGAFTRAMQQATAFRQERKQMLAELRFQQENPELAIVEMIKKDPTLADKVNEQIEKLGDDDKSRLFDTDVKTARDKASKYINDESDKTEQLLQRADQIEAYVRRAGKRLRLSDEAIEDIEESIAAALERKPADKRDLTDAELDEIVIRKAKLYRREDRTRRTADAKRRIQERTRDRKNDPPKVRSANTPAAALSKKAPTNDAEFTELMLAKL